ncbi:hypothetical protein BD779DRAFT_1540411 [Infundibulicybe gibba]|nr:hypothetical protein BD779DRAFT_1540411 [Infundibulicybe gibba]
MAPRRGAPPSNTLSPQDYSTPSGPPSPAFLGLPRANSPSSGGFSQFLSRPSKWFGRSSSASKLPSGVAEPRPSTSFPGGRKHKISRPTDPRPILDNYAGPASR